MIPATTDRLVRHTPDRANEVISEHMHDSVARHASGTPQLLEQRLHELDREWDVERLTATLSGVTLLVSVLLVSVFGTAWLVLPALIGVCLLLHALVGWTPALALIRHLGWRTPQEIAHERYALKAIRGDFQTLSTVATPQDREDLSRFEGEGGPAAKEPEVDAGNPVVVIEVIRAAKS